jgi:hypothetical protein
MERAIRHGEDYVRYEKSVQNGQFDPWLAAQPLNLLAAVATTLGEVLPLDFCGQAPMPILPAKWLGRPFSFNPSNLRAGSPV